MTQECGKAIWSCVYVEPEEVYTRDHKLFSC